MTIAKILIADDNKGERELFSRVLMEDGYEVETAKNGVEALEKVKKGSFNLVFADIRMPRMGGVQLLKEIKKLKPEVMVMMITAYAVVDTAIQALREGAYDYITKPMEDVDEIGFRVRRALERQRLGKENKRLMGELKTTAKKLAASRGKFEKKVVVDERQDEPVNEDLKRAYKELKETYADLETSVSEMRRLERLAAMGEFSARIVHGFKNPLTSIDGFIQLLPSKYDSPEFRDKFIETLTREVGRLKDFTARLLKFARPHEPILKPEDVNKIIGLVLPAVKQQAAKQKVKVFKKLGRWLPKVIVEAESISEVLVNLINNAIEAMPDGGSLTLTTTRSKESVEIRVEDTGCGIAEENIPKIFEPFFTTRSKGTGLGLAICQGIIDKHNSRIDVKSQIGKGTMFSIKLPIEKS